MMRSGGILRKTRTPHLRCGEKPFTTVTVQARACALKCAMCEHAALDNAASSIASKRSTVAKAHTTLASYFVPNSPISPLDKAETSLLEKRSTSNTNTRYI